MPQFSHGVIMDISERKRRRSSVAFLAYHDELTGLPSRSMFEELLSLSIARARRHDGSVAVVCRRPRRLRAGERLPRSSRTATSS